MSKRLMMFVLALTFLGSLGCEKSAPDATALQPGEKGKMHFEPGHGIPPEALARANANRQQNSAGKAAPTK